MVAVFVAAQYAGYARLVQGGFGEFEREGVVGFQNGNQLDGLLLRWLRRYSRSQRYPAIRAFGKTVPIFRQALRAIHI